MTDRLTDADIARGLDLAEAATPRPRRQGRGINRLTARNWTRTETVLSVGAFRSMKPTSAMRSHG